MNPAQPAFGGGASDGFMAVFVSDLSQLLYSTYWGGSNAEEVTSASSDSAYGWFIAGWTSSEDFPTANAVQPQYGGGLDDGFLVHYDASGSIHQSTFFGGSGSDRILNVTSSSPFQASLAGRTASMDLSLQNPQQSFLRGASDGFAAVINTKLIGAPHVTGSKGLRAYARLFLPATTATITVTTSDAASVLLADTVTAVASPSITTTAVQSAYYVECQAEGASADLTFTATGFPSSTARVDCVRPSISLAAPALQRGDAPGSYRIGLWSGSPQAYVSGTLYAINPNNRNDSNRLFAKSDQDRLAVEVQLSNPSVLKTSSSSLLLGGSSPESIGIAPLSIGTTDVVFAPMNVDAAVPGAVNIVVTPPFTIPTSLSIFRGFQLPYQQTFPAAVQPGLGAKVSFSSSDSSSLVISTSPTQIGSSTATVAFENGQISTVYFQALKSRVEASLTISVTGFDPVTIPVRLEDPTLTVSSALLFSPVLPVGTPQTLAVTFGPLVPNPQTGAVRVSVQTSGAAGITVQPGFIDLKPNAEFPGGGFTVRALAPGRACLTFLTSNNAVVPMSANPLCFTVPSPTLQLNDVVVGKNLAVPMRLSLPDIPPSTTVTISTSDPDSAIVGPNASSCNLVSCYFRPQISLTTYGSGVGFYVVGIKDSGSVTVTATVQGAGSVTATATLVPSGLGWASDFVTSDLYSSPPPALVTGYALDPLTLRPTAQQIVRPDISVTVRVQNDRPDVAVPVSSSIVFPRSTGVTMRNFTTGDATLTLIEPSEFSTPASRVRLSWRVTTALLSLARPVGQLGINTQQQLVFPNLPAVAIGKPATLTSSDPTKLVLSDSPNTLGSGTLTVAAGSPVYVQALDNRGAAYVMGSLEGFTDAAVPVELTGSGIALSVYRDGKTPGGSVMKADGAYTTLISGTTSITISLVFVNPDTGIQTGPASYSTVRPGIDPSIVVSSTNPNVGIVQRSPARLDQPENGRVSVDFQPITLGDTELTLVPPSGFIEVGGLPIHVTVPGLSISDPLLISIPPRSLGKDTAAPLLIDLSQNVAPLDTDLPIMIESSDPSRLVVSSDKLTPGSSTTSLTLAANRQSAGVIYLQALSDQGTVRLTITAPGFADTYVDIALSGTIFGINRDYQNDHLNLRTTDGRNGTIGFGTSQNAYISQSGGMIRPGRQITLHLESSDPSVVTIPNPNVTISSGASAAPFSMLPLRPGYATITLVAPDGFGVYPARQGGTLEIAVAP